MTNDRPDARPREGGGDLDARIDSALKRAFAPPAGIARRALPAHLRPGRPPFYARPIGWAAAAAVLVLCGVAVLGDDPEPGAPELAIAAAVLGTAAGPIAAPFAAEPLGCELERVFLQAVAWGFAPPMPCSTELGWDREFLGALSSQGCNTEEPTMVLGETYDPLLETSRLLMLRVAEEPVLMLVPRDESDTNLCLPPDSELRLYRGSWNGSAVYELSRLEESRVLECLHAEPVAIARL